MRPRPEVTVITHGFPVGGESRPRATATTSPLRRDPRRSSHFCRVGSWRCRSSSDRSRTGNYRFRVSAGRGRSAACPAVTGDHPRLPGRRTRRGEFADREAGNTVIDADVGCARASLARAQLPDETAAPRSTPQQSLLRRGSRRCRSSSDRSRTGNYRFESAGRGRSAASSGGAGVITHGFPVGELDAASSPTGSRG